jgi:trigger factor
LNITFIETDEGGNEVEGGIRKDNSVLVKYFSEEYRPSLIGKKKDDVVVAQLSQAFREKELEWIVNDLELKDGNAADKFFKMLITKVGHVEKAQMNEEFYKAAFPAKEIKSEEELRNTVKEEIQTHWNAQGRNHLQHEIYHVLLEHTSIDFPEFFLKKWMQSSGENPKTQEQVDHEYPGFVNQLKWTLITDKLVRENNIEVVPDDIKAFAKQQLFGYMGMGAMDEEQPWIVEYINRMMHDKKFVDDAYNRIQTDKIFEWAEARINAVDQPVSIEEFTKELDKHKHHHH